MKDTPHNGTQNEQITTKPWFLDVFIEFFLQKGRDYQLIG